MLSENSANTDNAAAQHQIRIQWDAKLNLPRKKMNTKGPSQDDNISEFPGRDRDSAEGGIGNSENAAPSIDELSRLAQLEELRNDAYETRLALQKKSFMNRMVMMSAAGIVIFIFFFLSARNPEIYDIDTATLKTINQAINALILLTVPFVLGSLGAFARTLISDITPDHKGGLIVSSGLMGVFSWVSIKSGVLIALIAPHIDKANLPKDTVVSGQSDFYTLALVAILVGMFSTNVYLMISQKVEQLTRQSKADKP
ncbi:hypothetical protein [Pseudomonas sp. IT-232MI5]|uniref:hypothetical protein n=1 Tax=Pseudomonas sp. IT-232MI5 TaxID=3026442 RepID=UPI0039DF61F0